MLDLFRFLFRCFVSLSIAVSSFVSIAVIAPPSGETDFGVPEYPQAAVKTLEEWGVTE